MPTLDLGVLVSGEGTNLQAILDAIATGALDARVRLVLSNKPGVGALARAERAGVPSAVLSHRDFADRAAFDAAMVERLRSAGCRWIVLAGFMRLLTPTFLDAFPWRVVNVHPSLLPAFPGAHALADALAYGVPLTGCTVHFVDAGTDTGPIVAQATIAVHDGDDEASLRARVHGEEHRLLVATLQRIAEGRVEVVPGEGGARPRVRTRPAERA
jgi:phosphoribosylglycinamide formyltransferase-1